MPAIVRRLSVLQSKDPKSVHFNASMDPLSPKEPTKQIQFHIDRLNGLSVASAIAVENLSKGHPHRVTTNKGRKNSEDVVLWEVNLPQMTLTESSTVKFVVEGRSVVGKRPAIGSTAEYTISNLLELMEKSEQEAKDIKDAYLPLKVDCRSPHQDVTLQVKVRELPTESTAKETAARVIKQAAENFKRESLKQLERMAATVLYFSNALVGTDVRCMADLTHGALATVRTPCESEKTHCARVVVGLLETINAIFDHYKAMSPRQLFKGSHSVSLNELFGNVVKGLWTVSIFMTAEFLERAHLEFKVSAWMTYFESLKPCLSDTQQIKPSPPEQSRRVIKLPDLNAKSGLPSLDRVETHLPVNFEEGADLYYPTPIRLISHWALSSTDDSSSKNFLLYGAAGCGKTHLAGEIIRAFSELGFFGAYFSFNHHSRKGMTSLQLLESFPATIMHQISGIEPDIERLMAHEIKTLSVISETLESKFQKLVVTPLRKLRASNLPYWQPDYPLLIVLDDLDSCTSEVLELLLNFLNDRVMERLPSHVRFLVLSRPSEEVYRRIGEVGFEILPSTMDAEESNCSTPTPSERHESSSGNSSVHSGWTSPSLCSKASIQAF